ncbi:MAG: type I 3-dehydroquinate dehydratase, partial [Bryobacteraceae bacterium]
MHSGLRRALRCAKTVELRLDWLSNQPEVDAFLRRLSINRRKTCVIATLRRVGAGGNFRGSLKEQWAGLLAAAEAGCAWCDLEVESAERLDREALGMVRKLGARLLVSFHDFRRTPADLRSIVGRLDRAGGGAIKLATKCHSLADAARLLSVARGRRNVIAVPMGEEAIAARVLALRQGSALAYAAGGEATAPGQLSFQAMRETFRANRLDRRTRVYGVIGDPVAHSISPAMHNAGYVARRVNAVYLPFRVDRSRRALREFLAGARALGVAGFSVTLPQKQAILRFLGGCDPLAARIGAANTVVVRGRGRLYGYNTDYVGVLRALERRVRLRGSRVLLLGAGG